MDGIQICVCVCVGGGRPNMVGLKFARLIKWTLGCGRREVLHKSEREQLLFIGDSGKKPKIPNIRVDCVLRKTRVVVEGLIRLEQILNTCTKSLWECQIVLVTEPTTKVAWQLDMTSLWNETLPTYIGYAWHGNAIHNQTWALMPLSRLGHVFCTSKNMCHV